MPGLAALLHSLARDRGHAVLDLGPAVSSNLSVYSRFARRVRFADLLTVARAGGGWAAVRDALPPQPEQPYNVLFAWNILDRLFPEERPLLVARLAELSAADASLHLLVEASGTAGPRPLHFTLLDTDRVRYEPASPTRQPRAPLLPAEVERLLAPFQVERAFTLKTGLREYVALRGTS